MNVVFTLENLEDYQYWAATDKKYSKRLVF